MNNTIGNAENVVLGHDYEYNESADADFFGGIVIDRDNVTIDGDNHYINGTGKNTVFYIINANNVTLKNIRFYNATMNVPDNYVNGGALCIENSSNINIINCNFLYCYAKTDGGAIYVKSTDPIRITDSIFKDNYAGYGGAITVHNGARLILENTTFEHNQAEIMGAALNGAHSTQIINNCTFKDNHIEMGNLISMGGAIYEQKIDGDNEIVINNTEFKNNTVYYGEGGAIYINLQSKVLIENSKFSENNASEGGAIVCNSEKVTITIRNTEFNENEAGYCGAVKAGSSTMIEDCNFTGNNAGGGGAIGVDGVSSEKSNATVRNCNFLNNSASYGGAIYIYDKVTILNCNFTSNNASIGGGAITCYAGSDRKATINNSNFIANSAEENGGAIVGLDESDISIENSNFIANSAESGGAVFTVLSSIEIENSNFTENSAENGGAVSTLSNQKTSINNVEFSKNTATGYGGAILINGSI